MFKNIVKLAFRNLVKNKLFSFISVFGLSLAIGCFALSFIFVDFWNNMDSFHKNIDEIYLVEIEINRSGSTQIWGPTPIPLGPSLKKDFPQIKNYVRIKPREGTFRYKDRVFEEELLFVDEGFLDMFTFPLVAGEKSALQDKNAVILSDRCAEKYFGDEDPIGKELVVTHGEEYRQSYFVKGVVEKNPVNSTIQFDILLPYVKLLDWDVEDLHNWGLWTHTFIQLASPEDVSVINANMDKYIQLQNAAEKDWPITSFIFEPLSDVSENSYKVINDIGWGVHPVSKIGNLMFGIFLLVLACFNYMNIAVATATRRLNEIGIRKVLGSTRIKLVLQFLSENILICLIAVIAGVIFAKNCLIPWFNVMFDASLDMDFSNNYRLWLFFVGTLLITGIGSGAYPAFYVSKFQPASILRKTQKVGGGSNLTKVLLSFQFGLTFIMIGSALIYAKNGEFQKNIDWGYNQDQVIGVEINGKKHFDVYRNAISQNPDIQHIAGSQDHIGRSSDIDVVEYEGNKYEICRFLVGYDYLKTMQSRLRDGRDFDRKLATDLDESIIINEKFARNLAWKQPVGMSVVISNTQYNVIGVVSDFHSESFVEPIEPTLFRLCDKEKFKFISIRAKAGTLVQTAEYLKGTWKTMAPDEPYKGFFQDEIWSRYFREIDSIILLVSFLALVALCISCMGLFGLISVSIVKRTKEISIRKILGASIPNLAKLLNKDLFIIMIVSSGIAAPLCYLINSSFLESFFEYYAPINIFVFIIACALMIVTSLLTVFSQVYKAARSNPVDMLRIE